EDRDAARDPRYPQISATIANGEATRGTASGDRLRPAVLQYESQPVGTLSQAALPCQLELELGLETAGHHLLPGVPHRAVLVIARGSQTQRATRLAGTRDHLERSRRREIGVVERRGLRREGRGDYEPPAIAHTTYTYEGAAQVARRSRLLPEFVDRSER